MVIQVLLYKTEQDGISSLVCVSSWRAHERLYQE
jgi:hypothetical protein